jgi:hypothetical protein
VTDAEDTWAHLLPRPGPLAQACPKCRLPGQLAIETRREWADPPSGGWPAGVAAARLAAACRRCGSDYLTQTHELVAVMEAGPGLPAAKMMPWLTCSLCDHGEAARWWAWMKCARCGYEDRAQVSRR